MTQLADIRFTGIPVADNAQAFGGLAGRQALNGLSTVNREWPSVGTARFTASDAAIGGTRGTARFLIFNDNLVAPTNGFFTVSPSATALGGTTPYTTYSIRFLLYIPGVSAGNPVLVSARTGSPSGGAQTWGIYHAAGTGVVTFLGGGAIGTAGAGYYYLEIQVNNALTPKIVARLYNAATGAQVGSGGSLSPANTNMDFLGFGDYLNDGFQAAIGWSDIEIWDSYDADGAWSGAGSPASLTRTSSPRSAPTFPAGYDDGTPISASYTTYLNQGYGDNSRVYDLYVPNGTPANSNGFPVVMWAHSGFFTNGDKNEIPANWLKTLINAGYAVASVKYIRSTLTTGAYSAWGTNDGTLSGSTQGYGRYPSFIVDYKLAAVRIAAKASIASGGSGATGHANLDGGRIFASGYSAGGYIALAAAVSKDITSDGNASPRNLTIAGNTTYRNNESSVAYTGADPTFLGSIVYAAPIDMNVACTWDRTDGSSTNPTGKIQQVAYTRSAAAGARGFVVCAAQAFSGQTLSATTPTTFLNQADIPNLIARQVGSLGGGTGAASVPPIAYVETTSDLLVHWEHEDLLSAQMTSSGIASKYTHLTTPTFHDEANTLFSATDLTTWLDARVVASGGTPGFGSASSGTPSLPSIPLLPSLP